MNDFSDARSFAQASRNARRGITAESRMSCPTNREEFGAQRWRPAVPSRLYRGNLRATTIVPPATVPSRRFLMYAAVRYSGLDALC